MPDNDEMLGVGSRTRGILYLIAIRNTPCQMEEERSRVRVAIAHAGAAGTLNSASADLDPDEIRQVVAQLQMWLTMVR